MFKKITLRKNDAGPLWGLCVMYPAPGVIERIGRDWDWIWVDAQHGDLDLRETTDLIRAANFIERPVIVRPPGQDAGWVGRILDAGASGLLIPMIESVEEARAMVCAAKFPPLGNRSYGGRRVIDLQGREYYKTANEETLLILQVESDEAVAIADSLAGEEGVDGLFLGPDDLLIRTGQDVDAPKTPETIGLQTETVAAACKKHGKLLAGIGASATTMALARTHGFDLTVGGADVAFLAAGSKTMAAQARAFFANSEEADSPSGASSLY